MIRNIFLDDNQEYKVQEIIEPNNSTFSLKIELRKIKDSEEFKRLMNFATEQVLSDMKNIKQFSK